MGTREWDGRVGFFVDNGVGREMPGVLAVA